MTMTNAFQKLLSENQPVNRVLVAQTSTHKMAIHAWAEGGLELLDLKNGYGLQIICDGGQYPTIQLWKYAINEKPKQQTWVKQKTVFQKRIPLIPKSKPVKINEIPTFEHQKEAKEI
jgi:hypothetical protein